MMKATKKKHGKKWVKVSDELPPIDRWVLACTGDGVAIAALLDKGGYKEDNGFCWCAVSAMNIRRYERFGYFTHWQLLPELPEAPDDN